MFIYLKELSPEYITLPLNAITVEMLPADLAEQANRRGLVILMGKDGSRHLKHWGKTQHATTDYTMTVPLEPPIIPEGWQFVEFATERGTERRGNRQLTDAVYHWVRSGVDETELTCLITDEKRGFAYSRWNEDSSVWEPWRHTWNGELVEGETPAVQAMAEVIPF